MLFIRQVGVGIHLECAISIRGVEQCTSACAQGSACYLSVRVCRRFFIYYCSDTVKVSMFIGARAEEVVARRSALSVSLLSLHPQPFRKYKTGHVLLFISALSTSALDYNLSQPTLRTFCFHPSTLTAMSSSSEQIEELDTAS